MFNILTCAAAIKAERGRSSDRQSIENSHLNACQDISVRNSSIFDRIGIEEGVAGDCAMLKHAHGIPSLATRPRTGLGDLFAMFGVVGFRRRRVN